MAYGNCVECHFPILLNGSEKVQCPFCATVNQPASVSLNKGWIWAGIIVAGVILLSKVK